MWICSLILVFVCVASVASDTLYPPESSKVLELHTSNYRSVIATLRHTYPIVLVEFYSSWCGHCRSYAPTYESLAAKVLAANLNARIVSLNCISDKEICTEMKIGAYPTIIKFTGSDEETVKDRTEDALYNLLSQYGTLSEGEKHVAVIAPALLKKALREGHAQSNEIVIDSMDPYDSITDLRLRAKVYISIYNILRC